VTAAEKLRAEGEAVGLVKGRAEGLVKGRAEGKAEVVLRQLRLRFGEVPEEVRQGIVNASSDELDVFADCIIITAANVDDVCVHPGKVTVDRKVR
jgi:hypothetical protein